MSSIVDGLLSFRGLLELSGISNASIRVNVLYLHGDVSACFKLWIVGCGDSETCMPFLSIFSCTRGNFEC